MGLGVGRVLEQRESCLRELLELCASVRPFRRNGRDELASAQTVRSHHTARACSTRDEGRVSAGLWVQSVRGREHDLLASVSRKE